MSGLLMAQWPAPEGVVAFTTTRTGGVSEGRYGTFNLGHRVGDCVEAVTHNRQRLLALSPGLREVQWLEQVHGTAVAEVREVASPPAADAAICAVPGVACAVLTADCLPVLLCDSAGLQVAAVHAGWRGLCAGVVAATVSRFRAPGGEILAWLGPAISQACFEVGGEVREQFLRDFSPVAAAQIDAAFTPSDRPGQYRADLYALCRAQLHALGVSRVSGGEHCTYRESERFYSYRRDGVTGRMASVIYRRPTPL